jgi:hypothetical protein
MDVPMCLGGFGTRLHLIVEQTYVASASWRCQHGLIKAVILAVQSIDYRQELDGPAIGVTVPSCLDRIDPVGDPAILAISSPAVTAAR